MWDEWLENQIQYMCNMSGYCQLVWMVMGSTRRDSKGSLQGFLHLVPPKSTASWISAQSNSQLLPNQSQQGSLGSSKARDAGNRPTNLTENTACCTQPKSEARVPSQPIKAQEGRLLSLGDEEKNTSTGCESRSLCGGIPAFVKFMLRAFPGFNSSVFASPKKGAFFPPFSHQEAAGF